MSWRERRPFDKGLAELRKRALQKPREDRPGMVLRGEIKMAHSVMQPRLSEKDGAHIDELGRAIRANKGTSNPLLDPVLVVMIGQSIICVDGHHRLLAYQKAGENGEVPVEWFEGTIEDAVAEASHRNSKDRLPMTTEEKLEQAWKLVWLRQHTRHQIATSTGVSPRTVSTMRGTLKKLQDDLEKREGDEAGGWASGEDLPWRTWREARKGLIGEERREFTEEMRAAAVRDLAATIKRTIGRKIRNKPDVFADALEMYRSDLPRQLVGCWIEEAIQIAGEVNEEETECGDADT